MKKIFCLLLIFVFAMGLCATASADGVKIWTVEEFGISIALPEDYYVANRNTTSNDIAEHMWYDSAADMQRHFKDNDVWLSAADEQGLTIIELTIFPGAYEMGEINRENYPDWEAYISSGMGDALESCEYKEINGIPFVCVVADDGDTDDLFQYAEYWTTFGDYCVYVYMDVYPYLLDDSDFALLESIAGSLDWNGDDSFGGYTNELTRRKGAPTFEDGYEGITPSVSVTPGAGGRGSYDGLFDILPEGLFAALLAAFIMQLVPAITLRSVILRRRAAGGAAVALTIIAAAVSFCSMFAVRMTNILILAAYVLLFAVIGLVVMLHGEAPEETWDMR